jgi:hypothetical protein
MFSSRTARRTQGLPVDLANEIDAGRVKDPRRLHATVTMSFSCAAHSTLDGTATVIRSFRLSGALTAELVGSDGMGRPSSDLFASTVDEYLASRHEAAFR